MNELQKGVLLDRAKEELDSLGYATSKLILFSQALLAGHYQNAEKTQEFLYSTCATFGVIKDLCEGLDEQTNYN